MMGWRDRVRRLTLDGMAGCPLPTETDRGCQRSLDPGDVWSGGNYIMPISVPVPPHGALGALKMSADIALPQVERPTKPSRKTVTDRSPATPHGALGEQTSLSPLYAEVVPPLVERPTKPPRRTVTHKSPTLPHGALGEVRAGMPPPYVEYAEVVLPQVERPTKQPRVKQ